MDGLERGIMNEELLRREILRVSHAVHERGWVANHDGNVTAQVAPGRYVSTPTAVSKGEVSGEMLIVVDGQGQVLQGTRSAFSELKLHLAAYRCREDIKAVLHAHPPTATGFAVAGVGLGNPFMAEPIVRLGAEVPLIPFGLPGDPSLEANLAGALGGADAVLLGGHGVLTVGPDSPRITISYHKVRSLAAAGKKTTFNIKPYKIASLISARRVPPRVACCTARYHSLLSHLFHSQPAA